LNIITGAGRVEKELEMRVYQGDSIIPNDPRPHTFVEIEPDGYLEVILPKLDSLDTGLQQRLRAFTRKTRAEEKKTKQYNIRMAYRYFAIINKTPNLRLIGNF